MTNSVEILVELSLAVPAVVHRSGGAQGSLRHDYQGASDLGDIGLRLVYRPYYASAVPLTVHGQ